MRAALAHSAPRLGLPIACSAPEHSCPRLAWLAAAGTFACAVAFACVGGNLAAEIVAETAGEGA